MVLTCYTGTLFFASSLAPPRVTLAARPQRDGSVPAVNHVSSEGADGSKSRNRLTVSRPSSPNLLSSTLSSSDRFCLARAIIRSPSTVNLMTRWFPSCVSVLVVNQPARSSSRTTLCTACREIPKPRAKFDAWFGPQLSALKKTSWRPVRPSKPSRSSLPSSQAATLSLKPPAALARRRSQEHRAGRRAQAGAPIRASPPQRESELPSDPSARAGVPSAQRQQAKAALQTGQTRSF